MKLLKSTLVSCFFVSSSLCLAANPTSSAVNKSSCALMANTTQPFILVLDSGDDLIPSITQCAKDAGLLGASVAGLGQVQDPTLAYFSSNPKDKPSLTTFKGVYELVSISGDITNNDNNYYTHLHTVLADAQFHALAGHLNNAKAGLTAEITITPLSAKLERTVDATTGFGPIVH